MKKIKLHVKGLHCPSCDIYMERELQNIKGISDIKSDHKEQTVTFNSTNDYKEEELIKDINKMIEKNGYSVQKDPIKTNFNWKVLLIPFFISLFLMTLFFLLQKSRFFYNISLSQNTYITAFLIGIIASFSSCMAVVGSIIISLSTTYKKKSSMILFHLSRIVSFFLLGGFLGLIGNTISFSDNFYTITGILLFFVMIIMGFNLLDIFPFFKKIQFKLPKQLTSNTFKNSTSPLLLGLLTFFLPCGFTQSMQILAISTGDILVASFTMLLFALGTFPVLAMLSFGISTLKEKFNTEILFKAAGFLIIFFALYNLMSLLTSLGIITFIY